MRSGKFRSCSSSKSAPSGTLLYGIQAAVGQSSSSVSITYFIALHIWLFLTVLFANFATAIAEERGKAQAETLRKTRVRGRLVTFEEILVALGRRIAPSRRQGVRALMVGLRRRLEFDSELRATIENDARMGYRRTHWDNFTAT